VTVESAHKNFETRGLTISASNSKAIDRVSEFSDNNEFFSDFYEMGVTLLEETTSQSGIWFGLDPAVSESNPNSTNWSMLDSFESALLEPDTVGLRSCFLVSDCLPGALRSI